MTTISNESNFFGKFVLSTTTIYPERDALADHRETLTYTQLASEAKRVAGLLQYFGLHPGDRVIVSAGNSVRQIVAHYGVLFAGGTVIPIGTDVPENKFSFLVEDASAKLIARNDGIYNTSNDRLATYEEARSQAEVCTPLTGERLAAIMYTTGSTGQPKGVMLSHNTLTSALAHIQDYVQYTGDERELVVLPISHSFGLGHVFCNHMAGGSVYLENGLTRMKRIFNILYEKRITGMPATPTICQLLLGRYKEKFLESAKHLQLMVVNSAPLMPETTKNMLSEMPHLRLIIYYGLTEASRSTFITLSDVDEAYFRSVGPAAKRVEITTLEGEVCIKGPHLFSGYWNQPDETEKAIRDSWFHTGDLGVIDEQGMLMITGRIKDQINVGGLKVSSQEVEKILKQHPNIEDLAVVGLDDPAHLKGQIVGALIVPQESVDDEQAFNEDIKQYGAQYLESYMLPEVIRLTDKIPRSASCKVLTGEVQACLS
jgi:long-chain acyl-CoA synthetase